MVRLRIFCCLIPLCMPAVFAQMPVTVTNSPAVTIENTPGVVLTNIPTVVVDNDRESPISVEIEDTVDNEPRSLLEFRIVGYTISRTSGRVEAESLSGLETGYAAMHGICQTEVHPSARAAFSHEALLPAAPLLGQVGRAWVIPSPSTYSYADPSEIASMNCDWYAREAGPQEEGENEVYLGLAIEANTNRLRVTSCGEVLPVACSVPVRIPIYNPPLPE